MCILNGLYYPNTHQTLAILKCDDEQYTLYISPNMEEKFRNWKIHVWYGNIHSTFQFEIYRPDLSIELCVPSKSKPIIKGPVREEQIEFFNLA